MVDIDAQRTNLNIGSLKAPAQSISLLNGPLLIIGQGPFPQSNSRIIFV